VPGRIPVFDLDGTLIDSDEALIAPFLGLGIAREDIQLGHPLDVECERLGVTVHAYLDRYDAGAAHPFSGVEELIASLDRWAVCSNKHPDSGWTELARLGWKPEVATFASPGGGAKELGPLLATLDLAPEQVVYVGDTAHDRACAVTVGCPFLLAGWNPRAVAGRMPGDLVIERPLEVLDHL
jgi:phosphoglycolate phosphatase-like HAD superfamily hydrolase